MSELNKVTEMDVSRRRMVCQMVSNELADRYSIPHHDVFLLPWWEMKPAIGENLVGHEIIILCEEFVNRNWDNKEVIADIIKHELAHYFYKYHCKGFRRVCDKMGIEEHTNWKHPEAWYPQ